jgi:YD repeat-containing protein
MVLCLVPVHPGAWASTGVTYTYDALNRIETITKPGSEKVSYGYSGSSVSITDERGYLTTCTYAAFGNPDEKRLNRVSNQGKGTTDYTYTAVGKLLTVTLSGGITHSYGYDGRQFLTSETHPEMGGSPSIQYTVDAVGNVLTRKDARGTTSHTYDTINRVKTVSYSDSTPGVAFAYFANDCLKQMTSGPASYGYTYYGDRKLKSKTCTIDGHSYTTGFTYNGLRNISSITYPSGRTVTYNYQSDNRRITSVYDSVLAINLVTGISYHASGQLSGFTYANGIATTVSYDDHNRVKNLGAGSLLSLGYGYDPAGNITSITDAVNSANSISMSGYDSLNRLTDITGPWGNFHYAYDYSGNRTSLTTGSSTITYSINAATNRLTSCTGPATYNFYYDGSGNIEEQEMGGGDQFLYTYDLANRMTDARLGTSTGTFQAISSHTYDGGGNRVKKATGTETRIYHYGIANEVIAETRPDGTPLIDYIYLGNNVVARYTWPNQ